MKPLSTLKFMKGSFRKVLPLVITVSLAVGLLYFVSITVNHIMNQNIQLNVSPLSNMSILAGSGVKVPDEQLEIDQEKLKSNKDIRSWVVTFLWKVNFKTNTSNNDMYMFLMKTENLPEVMKWQKQRLVSGRMPEKPYEIILHKDLADNYKLSVGSTVRKGTEGWSDLPQDVKVVGLFDGRAIMALGCMEDKLWNSKGFSLLTLTEDESVHAMNRFIEENFGSRYAIQTKDLMEKEINDKNRNIRIILNFVSVVVVIVLCVLLGNICMIQYTQRSKEFELLFALGYTKKYIGWKVLKEIGSSTVLGYGFGIILAIIGGWLLNESLLVEKALQIDLLQYKSMCWILLVPVMVTLSGMIVPIKVLQFRDLV